MLSHYNKESKQRQRKTDAQAGCWWQLYMIILCASLVGQSVNLEKEIYTDTQMPISRETEHE